MTSKSVLFALFFLTAFAMQAQNPLNAEECTLNTGNTTLHGTLLNPAAGKKPPVVLIIAGSGPTDRNGNNPMMQNNSLKMLAESLYGSGIATLRYDKRMIAASADSTLKESDIRFDQMVGDAASWINWLKQQGKFSKVIVAGHSEGSLIGMLAARQSGADGFISIAGAGEPADEVIRAQLATQPDYVTDIAFPILDSLKAGKTVQNVAPMLSALFRPDVQPYLISWFRYDPRAEIAKLTIPVLVIQGTTDIQVNVASAKALAAANPKAKLVVIEGMNHIFKPAEADRSKNIATYSKPDLAIVPELPEAVVKFVKKGK